MTKKVIALLMVLLLAVPGYAAVKKKAPKRTIQTMNYAAIAQKVLPSLVKITTDKYAGSGFFVSSEGNILTNYHVIDGAEKITAVFGENAPVVAHVKGFDTDGDVALLSITVSAPVPFLKISKTLPAQGEAIMALGNPQGLEGTISNGIVSAFRDNNTWIQFTAPVSEGSSGGALVNANGEVVGMPTLLFRKGQNLNFAISAPVLRSFLDSVKNNSLKTPGQETQGMSAEEWDRLWNGEASFSTDNPYHNNINLWETYKDFPTF